jgi:hypothetical protein
MMPAETTAPNTHKWLIDTRVARYDICASEDHGEATLDVHRCVDGDWVRYEDVCRALDVGAFCDDRINSSAERVAHGLLVEADRLYTSYALTATPREGETGFTIGQWINGVRDYLRSRR